MTRELIRTSTWGLNAASSNDRSEHRHIVLAKCERDRDKEIKYTQGNQSIYDSGRFIVTIMMIIIYE